MSQRNARPHVAIGSIKVQQHNQMVHVALAQPLSIQVSP
jgi:hypothetical protein